MHFYDFPTFILYNKLETVDKFQECTAIPYN